MLNENLPQQDVQRSHQYLDGWPRSFADWYKTHQAIHRDQSFSEPVDVSLYPQAGDWLFSRENSKTSADCSEPPCSLSDHSALFYPLAAAFRYHPCSCEHGTNTCWLRLVESNRPAYSFNGMRLKLTAKRFTPLCLGTRHVDFAVGWCHFLWPLT